MVVGTTVRICIVDDFPVVRKGIKDFLEEDAEFHVAGEAENAEEFMSLLKAQDFDLILLDIAMPGRSGLELLREIKSIRPDLPVVIFSMYPDEQYALQAIKAGADGYLNKTSDPAHLVAAIRRVIAGKKYISEGVAENLAGELGQDLAEPLHKRLSRREKEVMCCLAEGLTVSQTAQRLHLGGKTVGTYRMRVLRKMKMRNNVELTRYAIQNRLIG